MNCSLQIETVLNQQFKQPQKFQLVNHHIFSDMCVFVSTKYALKHSNIYFNHYNYQSTHS